MESLKAGEDLAPAQVANLLRCILRSRAKVAQLEWLLLRTVRWDVEQTDIGGRWNVSFTRSASRRPSFRERVLAACAAMADVSEVLEKRVHFFMDDDPFNEYPRYVSSETELTARQAIHFLSVKLRTHRPSHISGYSVAVFALNLHSGGFGLMETHF